MPAMVSIRLCLFLAINLAARSLQAAKDPLNDFCRRWGHQTAKVDGKLYIDGGQVAWNPLGPNSENYTNTWLLYSDLSTTTQDTGMPRQYANLTKNNTVPNVSGGILWADEINKCFYLYGGEFESNPADFSFWSYDTLLDQWNETKYTSNVDSIKRVSYGAGTQIPDIGVGFYYGGWTNSHNSPGWEGPPMATSNLIRYDFTDGTLNNNTGPDDVGRAEGGMVYLPASDGGLLVYMGGLEDLYHNGSSVEASMNTIHIFDVASSKWYSQNASGEVPPGRRQFCSGVTWADDHSSYNIYLYGGYGIDEVTGFDDAYILSLPSFTWIKAWPTDNNTVPLPHGGCTANVIDKDQMLIIGGWFTTTKMCDSPNSHGQHNMNLGYNGPARTLWDKYDPDVSDYFVPTPVISAIGGGPTGGATATKPSTWDNPDLSVYFARVPSFTPRASTRTIPSDTGTPSNEDSSSDTDVGAIVGGLVGGLAGLIGILLLILCCLHRRKKALKKNNGNDNQASLPPPAELAATPSVREIHSPTPGKYIAMRPPDPSAHPAHLSAASSYAGPEQYSPNSLYTPQPYGSTSPNTAMSHPSTYNIELPQQPQKYHQNNNYLPYTDNPAAYDPQNAPYSPPYPPPSDAVLQRQHSYPTPTSPAHAQLAPTQQPQIYYPPPPEPSTRSNPSFNDRMGSAEGIRNSDTTNHPPSTTNTPAQFYAQPVPVHGQNWMSGGAGLSAGVQGGEGSSLRSFEGGGSLRGSVDSRKRPIRGRFVEVDHM